MSFIDQYELEDDAELDGDASDGQLSSSADLLGRMLEVENKILALREGFELLDHRFEVVCDGVEAALNRHGERDKITHAQIAEVRDTGAQIGSYLDARSIDSVTEAIAALQVRSDCIADAHEHLLSSQASGAARVLDFQASLSKLQGEVTILRGIQEAKEGKEARSPPKKAECPLAADPAALQHQI